MTQSSNTVKPIRLDKEFLDSGISVQPDPQFTTLKQLVDPWFVFFVVGFF